MQGARLVVLALAVLAATAADPLNCIIDAGDGKIVDLSPLGNKNWGPLTTTSGYSILLTPCGTLSYDPVYMPEGNGKCTSTDLACQLYNSYPAYLVASTVTGSASAATNTTTMSLTGGDLCPGNGQNRRATITFTCGATEGQPVYVTEVTCEYKFSWSSSHACPKTPGDDGGSSGGLSGGDVFLIIFFVGGFLYVAIGYAYMFKFKEARGVEAVPNIEFWRSLPGLCKDGAVFAWEKTKGLFSRS